MGDRHNEYRLDVVPFEFLLTVYVVFPKTDCSAALSISCGAWLLPRVITKSFILSVTQRCRLVPLPRFQRSSARSGERLYGMKKNKAPVRRYETSSSPPPPLALYWKLFRVHVFPLHFDIKRNQSKSEPHPAVGFNNHTLIYTHDGSSQVTVDLYTDAWFW